MKRVRRFIVQFLCQSVPHFVHFMTCTLMILPVMGYCTCVPPSGRYVGAAKPRFKAVGGAGLISLIVHRELSAWRTSQVPDGQQAWVPGTRLSGADV